MTGQKPLVLYVNPQWRRAGAIHTPLLNPWWGNPLTDFSLFTKQAFDAYSFDTRVYTITDDIHAADLVLLPYPHVWFLRHDQDFFNKCLTTAAQYGLPILIDGSGDYEYPIPENAIVLRYTGYRFKKDPRVIPIPLFTDDLLGRCSGGVLTIREKRSGKAVVGFTGWASLSRTQLIKTLFRELPIRIRSIFDSRYRACVKGVLWRKEIIALLKASTKVVFLGELRSSFSGSAKTAAGNLEALREQMVDTILKSDYALDVRGDANNSARLFEILSLGRIPVIIDTERTFPFADVIDYSAFSLIVDFRDIDHLADRIADFHAHITPEAFADMQRKAREAYVTYFRIDALMPHLVAEIRKKLKELPVLH